MRTRSGNKEKSIANAAIKVFARDGFHGAKITKIAEEAGVATGSVYLYFKNKDAILHHLFSQLWHELHEAFEEVTRSRELSPTEKIEQLIDRLFDKFSRNPSLALLFVNEQPHLLREGTGEFMQYYVDFLQMGERIVRQGIASGAFKQSVDARIFTNLVFGSIRQLLHQWARAPRQFPLNVIRREIKTVFLQGINS